ncbi:ABC transporter substrate-binding protein [Actinokineospora sp. PR83]|uniref:ABC transporter substrate-binding protein n=1 Tax=Actinokineospora sp. PR83 TaxID=2884908 RepID=UPI001F33A277|nr:ABC transporter substrate-binding protein [Actinokineospora sp. PR83]MCG8914473.1 ABC transporter substrate-binding protein [Actinokineospora sp. PR83]
MFVRPLVTLAVTVVALGAAACGTGTTGTGASGDAARAAGEGKTQYPVTISNCGKDYTFDKAPSRVVLMNGGSVAEVSSILALGVQGSVVANAQSYGASDVPGRAEAIKALPTGGVALNAQQDIPREAMLGLRPDFVISTYEGGFSSETGFATRDDLAGIKANTYVPGVSCGATGTVAGTPTIEDSYALLRDLGKIFDVPGRAEQVIAESKKRIEEATAAVAGKPTKNVLLVFPGMGADDFSSIAAAGVWNDVLAKAGGANPFDDPAGTMFATVSKEKLATTAIDAVIVVNYMNPDPEGSAKKILAQFPQWEAAKNQRFLILSDSVYFGPSNDVAVDKIADLLHADGS